MYDVSIIIASYFPIYEKLCSTVKSILNQKNISFEIIITDDGSQENYFEKIQHFFLKSGFKNYQLVEHKKNVGTCKNIYDALIKANGCYVKTISPGDFLYDEYTLSKWVRFMEVTEAKISFGDIINYHMSENKKIVLDREKMRPQLIDIYSKYRHRNVLISYVLLSDVPVGACFIVEKNTLIQYLNLIVGRIKYAEDFAFRLMLLDNIEIHHFDEKVVWYEFGTGISTSNNDKWSNVLREEMHILEDIIVERYSGNTGFAGRYSKYLEKKKKNPQYRYFKYIIFPKAIYYRFKMRNNIYTSIQEKKEIIYSIVQNNDNL